MTQDKTWFPDTVVTRWKVVKDFWKMPLNLSEVDGRHNVTLLDDIFSYKDKDESTMVVDFSNRKIGGGCFGKGFVQEEQMVAQSSDFATVLLWDYVENKTLKIRPHQCLTISGMSYDLWWNKANAMLKESIVATSILPTNTKAMTILAIAAPTWATIRVSGIRGRSSRPS